MRILLMLLFAGLFYTASAQTNGGCPSGTYPTVSISLDMFNLHKPRTSCSKGFGLCIKFSIKLTCESYAKTSYIKENKVFGNISLVNNVAELHIPIDLKKQIGFEKTDLSFFEVEDKAISLVLPSNVEKYVKGGVYPVRMVGEEYIVNLPLY